MIPSSLRHHVRSEPNDEDRIRLYMEALRNGVVVLTLTDIPDEWERALAQRLGEEQINRMKRELQAYSNVRSIR